MNNHIENIYKLDISPGILKLLGPNLYTNIYYIIAELIANAYDADAKNVYIISKPDSVTIEDDGFGMSYEDTKTYLKVAVPTRIKEEDSYTTNNRRKIGRKGVGKLAALSVSDDVWVQTIKDGKKLGFILSINIKDDSILDSLEDQNIRFEKIKEHGTSVIMKYPKYRLHKSLEVIKRNLIKLFPLVDSNFQIHIVQNNQEIIIDSFDKEIIGELAGLIIVGKKFEFLKDYFNDPYPHKEKKLLEIKEEEIEKIKIVNNFGEEKEYDLTIRGWIGAYKTTKGRKGIYDFPDNFISLISNGKLGEYNILPHITKNRLPEVYVVGQLHVDLFEETELPDMALSNRQGYKTDDLRYEKVISYVSKVLLPNIIELRTRYAKYENEDKKRREEEDLRRKEEELKKSVEKFGVEISSNAIGKISKEMPQYDKRSLEKIEKIFKKEANAALSLIKLKNIVDAQKKKILISHAGEDKDLADIIYRLLLFNGVPSKDILYTSCDDQICRIPDGEEVYDYLRDFFVNTSSSEKIFAIYVTSKNMDESWNAILEVGAVWITQKDHRIFNIEGYRPSKPLNIDIEWCNIIRNEDNSFSICFVDCDKFAERIENICSMCGYNIRNREENINMIKSFVNIIQ